MANMVIQDAVMLVAQHPVQRLQAEHILGFLLSRQGSANQKIDNRVANTRQILAAGDICTA